MVLIRGLCVALLTCFCSFSAVGQEDIDHFGLMRDFSRCAAIYDHAAEIGEQLGKPATAEEYRGAGRGARLVANFNAMLVDAPGEGANSEDWERYQANAEMRVEQIDSIYAVELNRQRAWLESGDVDLDGMKMCIELNPLQASLIEEMRRSGTMSGSSE